MREFVDPLSADVVYVRQTWCQSRSASYRQIRL